MSRLPRPFHAFTFAGLLLSPLALPPATAHGGTALVMLRYRFVPGQTLAYHFVATGRATATGDLSIQDGFTMPYRSSASVIVRERVQSVDARGRAMVAVSVRILRATETRGRTTTTSPLTTQTTTVRIAADGSVSGATGTAANDAFFLPLGTLPPGPLAAGVQWASPSLLLRTLTPADSAHYPHPTVTNTLLRAGAAGGTGMATISSIARPLYVPMTFPGGGGTTLRVGGSGQATGQTMFDVAAGRLIASTASYTLEVDQQLRDRRGGVRRARTRITWQMSTRRV